MSVYRVFKGHNSPHAVIVKDVLGVTYTSAAMAGITRVYFKYIPASGEDAEYADSENGAHADVFDWSTYASTGKLLIDLGMLELTAGHDRVAELVVYDATYTDGRVVARLDTIVSEDVYGDVATVGALGSIPPVNATDDYDITSASFGGSVRINAVASKTLTLPSVGASDDGKRLTIIKVGAGDAVVACSDLDTIGNGVHTQLTGTSTYAAITLEYVHAITTWVVIDGSGSWSGS